MRRLLMDIKTYNADGRESLGQLNAAYDELKSKFGFDKEPIYAINVETDRALDVVTVYCYRSARKGPALWVLSGIHGEEPAGPNAIAQNIDYLGKLGQDIPVVIIPLLNPKGYCRDWRYPDERRDWHIGHSVGDSEHYLPDRKDPGQPRVAVPRSEIAAKVTKFVLDATFDYPPVLTFDHHEDEELERGYLYSQGHEAAADEVAKEVIRILTESGLPLTMHGRTRFGEPIKNGVVVDENGQPVKDGSIDELLTAEKIIVAGEIVARRSALTSLVIETPIVNVLLRRRIEAHSHILRRLRSLWALANKSDFPA
jgi:hypothetical protein